MNTYIFTSPRFRPLDIAGLIMPGAYLQFFLSETVTPTPVYGAVPPASSLGTQVDADGEGEFPTIYMDPEITYRVKLFDADDVLQWDVDPYTPPRDYPNGTVVWFYGDVTARDAAYPPALWQVLDGTNGTPDARDRVPMFAGGSYEAGDTGGSSGSSVTGAAGAHDHTGNTGATALDATQIPTHTHRLYCWLGLGSDGEHDGVGWTGAGLAAQRGAQPSGGSFGYGNANGSATQLVEDAGAGSPATHTHTIAAAVDHTHTVSGGLPPFIALWAMMRRA